ALGTRGPATARGHEPGGRGGAAGAKGAGAFQWKCQPGGECARSQPQRAVPKAATIRPVTEKRKIARVGYEGRIVLLALMAGLPGSVTALWILWAGTYAPRTQWTLTVLIVGAWMGFALAVKERVVFPLQTVSNLLGALREGDFSVRGRSPRPDDALGEVMREVNTLGSTLREQRLGAMEATTLLRSVLREIAVAIFAFDENQRLRLVNRAGEPLLNAPAERLLGQTSHELSM